MLTLLLEALRIKNKWKKNLYFLIVFLIGINFFCRGHVFFCWLGGSQQKPKKRNLAIFFKSKVLQPSKKNMFFRQKHIWKNVFYLEKYIFPAKQKIEKYFLFKKHRINLSHFCPWSLSFRYTLRFVLFGKDFCTNCFLATFFWDKWARTSKIWAK